MSESSLGEYWNLVERAERCLEVDSKDSVPWYCVYENPNSNLSNELCVPRSCNRILVGGFEKLGKGVLAPRIERHEGSEDARRRGRHE